MGHSGHPDVVSTPVIQEIKEVEDQEFKVFLG